MDSFNRFPTGHEAQDNGYGDNFEFLRSSTQNFEEFKFDDLPFDSENDPGFPGHLSPASSGGLLRRETEMSFNLSGFNPDFFENAAAELGANGTEDGALQDPSTSVTGFQIPAEEEIQKTTAEGSSESQMNGPVLDQTNFLASFDEQRVQPTMLGKQQVIDYDRENPFDICDDGITEDLESKRLKMT